MSEKRLKCEGNHFPVKEEEFGTKEFRIRGKRNVPTAREYTMGIALDAFNVVEKGIKPQIVNN